MAIEALVGPTEKLGTWWLQSWLGRRKLYRDLLGIGTEPQRRGNSPITLLEPELAVVDYSGREAERKDLRDWCDRAGETDSLALRIYEGDGGIGKTRLMVQFIRELRKGPGGWKAGFLAPAADLKSIRVLATADTRWLFVVVDDAESRRGQIEPLVDAAQASKRHRVRIVLLTRSKAGWWEAMRRQPTYGSFFAGAGVTEMPRLRPVAGTPEERRKHFEAAARQFAPHLRRSRSVEAPPLEDELFDRILYVHALALAMLQGSSPLPAQEVFDWLLNRERGLMAERAREAGLGSVADGMVEGAVLLRLAGGVDSRAEAVEVLARTPVLSGEGTASLRKVAEMLRTLYPGRQWSQGVQPDPLGEHLVGTVLRDPDSRPELLSAAFGEGVSPERRQAGIAVLGRLAQADPGNSIFLDEVFTAGLAETAEPAIRAAQMIGDPIGQRLAAALERSGDEKLARRLEGALPKVTTALREVAAQVTGMVLASLAADAEPEERARLLNNLSNRLADLGDREGALSAIEEAVALYRRLAASQPEAFEPDLASSLNNMAACLADVGDYVEALSLIEEAVGLCRRLAASRPEAFEPDLAMSLNNLSIRLAALGDRERALAVIEEAVGLYRRLAASPPEVFDPDLASSLNNLSNRLADYGDPEGALSAMKEAVGLYRRLAASRPEAFDPDLAMSLNNLSVRLAELGDGAGALTAIEEAVALFRRLAASRPEAFEPDLAMSLNNLSNRLTSLEDNERALWSVEEAVGLYRRLAASHLEAFEADLATALNNLSANLAALGNRERALSVVEEAVELWRSLAASRPEAFEPSLARSLGVKSTLLLDLDRPDEAVQAAEEGLVRLWPHFSRFPEALGDLARHELRIYDIAVQAAGCDHDEALLQPYRERLQELEQQQG